LREDACGAVKIDPAHPLAPRSPQFAPKAKRVIYLFMAGGPSQLELFEDKPKLRELSGQAPPPSLLHGMVTDVFNHAPAKLFMNTGFQAPGRPAMGAWATYGIGSESRDLPGFVVLQSGPRGPRGGSSLWSSGFLPTSYQGVPFRGKGDPILYLRSPEGQTRDK